MPDMSVHDKFRRVPIIFAALLLVPLAGCQELVHMGQISDREAAFSIGNVLIEQQQPDGAWKQLGKTDGNGRWWIPKDRISSGGKIRLSKPGYFPATIPESEFLQQTNILLIPTGGADSGNS